jgi:NAD/NADP octopine/nopaline dehydrogenase, alpha-helical domain
MSSDLKSAKQETIPKHRGKSVLAICGGGNAAHAVAVVASQNFDGDIVWLRGSEEKAESLRRGVFSAGGLRSTGVITGLANKVRTISSDPQEIIPGADLVFLVVPAFAHVTWLEKIAPHLKTTAVFGALPARSGFEFDVLRMIPGVRPGGGRQIFGLQTLPWSTRVQQPGKLANIGALKAKVFVATLPGSHAASLAPLLSTLLGTEVIASPNFLNLTLGNPGQIIHPGIMYGWFSKWSGKRYREDEIPRFFADLTDCTGKIVQSLSNDVIAVAQKIGAASNGKLDMSATLPIYEWLCMSYPAQTADFSSVASCFRTGPIQARKAPMAEVAPGEFVPDFQYRYISEDVPYGLAIAKSIGQMADVATPTLDAVIDWSQNKLGKRYLVNGKLAGEDVHELRIPQNYGLQNLSELLAFYLQSDITMGLQVNHVPPACRPAQRFLPGRRRA